MAVGVADGDARVIYLISIGLIFCVAVIAGIAQTVRRGRP